MSTYATAVPGTALVGQATLNAKTAYQKALAQINQRRSATLRQAGYVGDINGETGTVGNIRVDAGNKYGQFQQLNRQQAQQDEAARWGAMERGLGSGGGLAAQMVNDARYNFGAQDAQMGQDLIGALQGYQGQQDEAGQARDAAMYQAQLEAARMAIDNQDWNPADYSDLEYPEYGEDASPAAPSGTAGSGRKTTFSYNPRAYVPGGSTLKVAKAIQAKGKAPAKKPVAQSAPKRILPPAQAKMAAAAKKKGK